jgi:hypothetical protein
MLRRVLRKGVWIKGQTLCSRHSAIGLDKGTDTLWQTLCGTYVRALDAGILGGAVPDSEGGVRGDAVCDNSCPDENEN